jgi:hypothetical protein
MVIAPWWPAGRVNRPRAGDPRSDPLARYDRRGNILERSGTLDR